MNICNYCGKEIEDTFDMVFIENYGDVELYCNDKCYDESFILDIEIKPINHISQMGHFVECISKVVEEDISKNKGFINKTTKFLNEKLVDGYPSPMLLNRAIQEYKYTNPNLEDFDSIEYKLNIVFKQLKNTYIKKAISEIKKEAIRNREVNLNYELFLDKPFKWTSKKVEKVYVTNVSSEGVETPIKGNEDDEFSILLPTDKELIKNKKLEYRMYAHQQTISNKNPKEKHRYVVKGKIDMNMNKYCEQLQMVGKTYKRQLKKLIKDGYIKEEIKNGEKYYILPHISEMDIELLYVEVQATTLRKLVNACSDNALKIYVIIKSYTRTKGKCKLSANKFLEMLGMSTKASDNRQMVYDCLDILTRKDKNGESFVTFEGIETVYTDEGKALEINTYKA